MFLKITDQDVSFNSSYTFVTVEPTGELKPLISVSYNGARNFGLSRGERIQQFLIEKLTPAQEKDKLKTIFGSSHDNSKAESAQKEMFEKFVEKFGEFFEKLWKKENIQIPNEPTVQPIYFYYKGTEESSVTGGEIFREPLRKKVGSISLTKIVVYAGEDAKLCTIVSAKEHEDNITKATQLAIQSISRAACLDINDIFRKTRGDVSEGPSGMK